MRNAMVVSILASATFFGTFMSGAAAAVHASSNNGNGNQNTISGTLVATPQSTLPATLMLQSGSQRLAVVVTSSTQVTDDNGNTLSLSSMTDGDSLQVVGAGSGQPGSGQGPSGPGNDGQSRNHDQSRGKQSSQHAGTTSNKITAASIEDLSVSSSSGSGYTVSGTLDEEYSGVLCLSSASVTASDLKLHRTADTVCSTGDLPVYVASSTAYENSSSTTVTLSDLATSDSLRVAGTISDGEFTATTVQDLSN